MRRGDAMTPEELLRRYPRETVRWLRDRLGLGLAAFAKRAEVQQLTVAGWEDGRAPIRRKASYLRLAALLAPHLATPAGEAFVQSLGRGEAPKP